MHILVQRVDVLAELRQELLPQRIDLRVNVRHKLGCKLDGTLIDSRAMPSAGWWPARLPANWLRAPLALWSVLSVRACGCFPLAASGTQSAPKCLTATSGM